MRILIASFGVRGDVQPYLALAAGLQAAGHRVTLATSDNFTAWIHSYGVSAHPAPFNMAAFTQAPETRAILRSGNLIRQVRLLRDLMRQNAAAQDEVWAASQDADFIIQSPTASGALEAVSRRGPPPVYVGFGSMNHADPERQTRLARRALELSGQRGVLLTGWGGLTRPAGEAAPSAASDTVCFVDDVPHAWLFPRMAAVVHHGGAGTTGAALRAGVPGILTPAAPNDQPAWAERVAALGVGPRVPSLKALTAETLAAAIQTAVNDPGMRARAAALGDKIRAEAGVARAVEIIEGLGAGLPARAGGKGRAA